MLQPVLPGAVFVDLFSGSGAIGIEALSRGAKKAYFVEIGFKAFDCIRQNLAFTKLADRAIVIRQEASLALREIAEKEADIVFLDPPYNCGHEQKVLGVLKELSWVTKETRVIVEAALDEDFSWAQEMGFYVEREKRYKTNKHVFLRRTVGIS